MKQRNNNNNKTKEQKRDKEYIQLTLTSQFHKIVRHFKNLTAFAVRFSKCV